MVVCYSSSSQQYLTTKYTLKCALELFFLLRGIFFPCQCFGVLRFTNRLISTADFTIGTKVCLSPKKNAMCIPPLWGKRRLWWSYFSVLGAEKPWPEIQNTWRLSEINTTKYPIIMQYCMHFLPAGTKELLNKRDLNWNTTYGWE